MFGRPSFERTITARIENSANTMVESDQMRLEFNEFWHMNGADMDSNYV